MHKKLNLNIGSYAFLFGIVFAIVLAVIDRPSTILAWIMITVGLIIGILMWMYHETIPTLIASVAFIVLAQFAPNALIEANMMLNILYKMTIVFTPVALLSAIKLVIVKK
ncbi:MAG: hypothetical protein KKG59_01370 [Nanoarchaeota archaeon]|nr:hypothetical protein [Nanoarchaeota archaeon]